IEYEIDGTKEAEDHPAVDISVGMEDSIHWFCRDKKFRVKSVYPAKENPDAPAQLFYRRFPEDNLKFAFHVNSGPARPEAGEKDYVYKPVFEFEDWWGLDAHIRTHRCA